MWACLLVLTLPAFAALPPLQLIEVSFYNVARSLTIVFNVLFTFALLGERTGSRTLATLAIVILGFLVGSGTEINFSAAGTFFGVCSSIFVSLNSIYTKRCMPHVDGNTWALAFYNNVNSALMFSIVSVLAGEPAMLMASPTLLQPRWWMLLGLSGFTGFAIGIVTILQIKVTSPLTHNISGTAKAAVQTVLALMIWRNPTTWLNLGGTALVLLGSLMYAVERTREMDSQRAGEPLKAVPSTATISDAAGSSTAAASADESEDESVDGASAQAEAAGLLRSRTASSLRAHGSPQEEAP